MKYTITPVFRIFSIYIVFFVSAGALIHEAAAQEDTSPTVALLDDALTSPALIAVSEPADDAAALYVAKCAGCHTIGGGELTGPDLLPSSQWPRGDLEAAIVRMEKNVGPLAAQEVQDLADLLMSNQARDRVASEQQRAAKALAAQMEPGSPSRGQDLFMGRKGLAKGGPPCMACHQVDGRGGTLGLDLTDVHARMGDVALISAIEGANFNVMRATYANRPVTQQEAIHIAAWLATAGGAPTASTSSAVAMIVLSATVITVLFLGAMALSYRRRSEGVRARLVQEASTRA